MARRDRVGFGDHRTNRTKRSPDQDPTDPDHDRGEDGQCDQQRALELRLRVLGLVERRTDDDHDPAIPEVLRPGQQPRLLQLQRHGLLDFLLSMRDRGELAGAQHRAIQQQARRRRQDRPVRRQHLGEDLRLRDDGRRRPRRGKPRPVEGGANVRVPRFETLVDLAAQVGAVTDQDEARDRRGREDRDDRENEHQAPAQPARPDPHAARKRYPTPRTVSMLSRSNGRSILLRRYRM